MVTALHECHRHDEVTRPPPGPWSLKKPCRPLPRPPRPLRRADDDRVEERWHLELSLPLACEGDTATPKLLSFRSAAVGNKERRRFWADLLKYKENNCKAASAFSTTKIGFQYVLHPWPACKIMRVSDFEISTKKEKQLENLALASASQIMSDNESLQ